MDNDRFRRDLRSAKDDLSGLSGQARRDVDEVGRHTSRLGSIMATGIGAAVRAGVVAVGAASVGLGAAITRGLNVAAFTEQAEISFGTLLGSAQAAKAYMAELSAFAAKTPFELPGLVGAARQLLGVGQAANTVIPTLTAWGDASGALGISQDAFSRAMLAVTQSMSKGKIQAEELMQITEAGIPVYALLSKALGLPVSELQKLASEGKLLAADVFPALEAQMQKDYGGSMEKQAATLTGVWSTVKDTLDQALGQAVMPLAAGLKTVLPAASAAASQAIGGIAVSLSDFTVDAIQAGRDFRDKYGQQISDGASGALDVVRRLGSEGAGALKPLGAGLMAVAENALPGLRELAGTAVDVLAAALRFAGGVAQEFAAHGSSLGESLSRIAGVASEVGEASLPLFNAALVVAGPLADALAGSLTMVAGVLEALGPALPILIAGFLGFQVVTAIVAAGALAWAAYGRVVATVAAQSLIVTTAMTGSLRAGAAVGGMVAGLGKALPVLGLGLILVGSLIEDQNQNLDRWAQALLNGGAASAAATRQMREQDAQTRQMSSGIQGVAADFLGIGTAVDVYADGASEAAARSRELYAAMSPIEQAQQDVTMATNNLSQAQKDHGVNSLYARDAAQSLRLAEEALEGKQRDLEGATRSATDALIEQAQQAMGAASADLALRQATAQVADAAANLNTVMADGTSTAEQRRDAEFQLEGAYYSAAAAAARKAEADNAGKTEAEISTASVEAQRVALEEMAVTAGGVVPPAVQTLIDSLSRSGGQAGITAAAMTDLKLRTEAIPGSKDIRVNAPTEDQRQRLSALGLTVTNIPGTKDVRVSAETSAAEAALAAFANRQWTTKIIAQISGLLPTFGTKSAGRSSGGGTFAGGGPVFGPGSGTSDSIPARLSNNEHIWTAREVRAAGGHGVVQALREAVLSGRGYSQGGPAGGGGAAEHSTMSLISDADIWRLAEAMARVQLNLDGQVVSERVTVGQTWNGKAR